jgi:hypothetical protein
LGIDPLWARFQAKIQKKPQNYFTQPEKSAQSAERFPPAQIERRPIELKEGRVKMLALSKGRCLGRSQR